MNIIDFLYDNYLWIVAILVIAIFTIIGFIADRKSKGKNGKGNENISTINSGAQAQVGATPANMNANMSMGNMANNNYQNVNYNNVPNNYANSGVVNPVNQVPNMGVNGNSIPNNITNVMPTNEQNINQTNQMVSNDNIPQGNFTDVVPTNNVNISNGVSNNNPMPEPTLNYNNQSFASENPSVINSWDEPKAINPVSINSGFNQNNAGNIPINNTLGQMPVQENVPINAIPNNMQQPVNVANNNMPNGGTVPGLNFVYGPNQNNNLQ